ncbi:hypothetical protein B0H16DRAFT_556110 [Mycena metata]|uniref:C2H2-type domain-containing protein n=1 Tax=Mycena metata TaxID=1033252 RepID=A0AAD7NHQ9_9AGAR|nr:hypothetical protein B0H16DRAFT_556110 [Mycena metata]
MADVAAEQEGDWDGEYEEEEEDEEDLAAEAAEVARRLEAQLWAEIKANGAPEPETTPVAAPGPPVEKPPNPKEITAVQTVRAILASLEHDSLAHSTLAASKIPEFAGDSLLDILHNMAASERIPPGVALPISRFLVSLAKSDVLFAGLRHSSAPAQTLKRKREEADEGERARKRVFIGNHPLYVEVAEAVRVVDQTLSPVQTPLGPKVIASIQPHLHRVFLFAVTAATAPGNPKTTPLQEISGLVQVLGVLSGIQITAKADPNATAAVHPCLVAGCGKVFVRAASLLAHQSSHDSSASPSKSAKAAEEGELDADVLTAVQTVVLILHPLLQPHVARALSASSAVNGSGGAATNGQATLASVIAAAQAQAQGAAAKSPAPPPVVAGAAAKSPPPPPVVAAAGPAPTPAAQADAEEDVDADGEDDGEGEAQA